MNKTIPTEWKILKIKDCIKQLNTGLNPRKNFTLGHGNIKYITAKNLVGHGQIDFSNCAYVDESAKKIINKRSDIKIGDVLFSCRAPLGQCYLITEDPNYFDIGESIFSIRADKNIVIPEYLSIYLSSDFFIKNASRRITGSVIEEIQVGNLLNSEIIVPPIAIQNRISKCIGNIDRKIISNNSINLELESVIKTLYNYWFLQFEFPNEEGKPYKSSGGNMIYNEKLKREIPEGWEVKTVLDYCSWEGTSQPPKSTFVYEQKKGYIRFIQNRDYEDETSHPTYIPLKNNTSTCEEKDILMDKYGDAGRVRFGLNGAYNVALSKIVVKNTLYREYIRSFFESEAIYNYLHNSSIASTRASLNENNVSYLYVAMPPKELLSKYNDIAELRIDNALKTRKENKQLVELRDFLLPMFMNGQVVFKEE